MNQQWLPVYISLLSPIATLAVVMVGFLYNNSRMSDLKDFVRAEVARMDGRINDLRDLLRAEMAKNHSEMLMKFAELDSRLIRIESHLNLK